MRYVKHWRCNRPSIVGAGGVRRLLVAAKSVCYYRREVQRFRLWHEYTPPVLPNKGDVSWREEMNTGVPVTSCWYIQHMRGRGKRVVPSTCESCYEKAMLSQSCARCFVFTYQDWDIIISNKEVPSLASPSQTSLIISSFYRYTSRLRTFCTWSSFGLPYVHTSYTSCIL